MQNSGNPKQAASTTAASSQPSATSAAVLLHSGRQGKCVLVVFTRLLHAGRVVVLIPF